MGKRPNADLPGVGDGAPKPIEGKKVVRKVVVTRPPIAKPVVSEPAQDPEQDGPRVLKKKGVRVTLKPFSTIKKPQGSVEPYQKPLVLPEI